MPKVSVIVPSYNYAAYIGECMESILNQRGFSDLELIVVDDASSDASREVIAGFRDPRVVFLEHETNQGHIRTINDGFRRATGEYVVHVGSDDYWHPEFLARTVPVLDAHPEVGLVHTNYVLVDGEGRVGAERGTNIPFSGDFKGDQLPWILFENYLPPAGTLFRREGLELVGGAFSEDLPYSEDWRLWLAIARRYECYFLDEPLVYYRVHDRNLHTGALRSRRGEEVEVRILDEFFADDALPARIRELRPRAYATQYRRYADSYFGFGMAGDCRRCLRAAVRHAPGTMLKPEFWKRYVAASVPRGVYRGIQSAYRKGLALFSPGVL
ncbi:MAG TPA: glycosyltransferase [Longimicrobiaceae bacterium]